MRKILFVVTLLLTGTLIGSAAQQATQEEYFAQKANDLITEGIAIFVKMGYNAGFKDGYGQARLECFENEGKLPTQRTEVDYEEATKEG